MDTRRINLNTDYIHELCVRYRVKDLYVFGSALRDDFRSDSDLDVVINPQEGHAISFDEFLDIQEELSRIADRPVDLVLFSQLESPRANRIRRRNILHTMERINGC